MFLQHLARLMAFRQQPYVLFLIAGLYLGITAYTISYICRAYEQQKEAVIMEVSLASPRISDEFITVVFGSNYTKQDVWLAKVHSMMSKKARAKFDQTFLISGGEIFQDGRIAYVPWDVLTVPNISDNPIPQVIRIDGRGTRISRRVTLLETSKNNMPIKEFTFDLKLHKKHGKVLITDIHVSNSQDGTTFEQFLQDASVIENDKQYMNNHTAATFYTTRNYLATYYSPRRGYSQMALLNNPKFSLARLQLVRDYLFDNQIGMAEKELSEARKYNTTPEMNRLILGYERAIEYVKKRHYSSI